MIFISFQRVSFLRMVWIMFNSWKAPFIGKCESVSFSWAHLESSLAIFAVEFDGAFWLFSGFLIEYRTWVVWWTVQMQWNSTVRMTGILNAMKSKCVCLVIEKWMEDEIKFRQEIYFSLEILWIIDFFLLLRWKKKGFHRQRINSPFM